MVALGGLRQLVPILLHYKSGYRKDCGKRRIGLNWRTAVTAELALIGGYSEPSLLLAIGSSCSRREALRICSEGDDGTLGEGLGDGLGDDR